MRKGDVKIKKLDQYDYIDDEFIYSVNEKYSRKIGEFIISFSMIEHELNIVLANLLSQGSHDIGYQIVEMLNTFNKIELFNKICSFYAYNTDKKKKIYIKSLKKELSEINTFRNNLIHANWTSLTKDRFVRTKIFTDDNGLIKFKFIKMNLKIINGKIKEADLLIGKLSDFLEFVSV